MEPSIQEPKTSWDLLQLTMTTQKWVSEAKKKNVDVDEEVQNIVQTIVDTLSIASEYEKLPEVVVLQQWKLRGMYCTRIIRKIAETEIKRWAEAGRNDPTLQSKRALIDDCERWALNQLPSIWQLGDPGPAERSYASLNYKINEVIGKIRSRM